MYCVVREYVVNVSNFSEGKGRGNQKRRQLDIEGDLWIEIIGIHLRLRWSRGSELAFSTQVRGFKPSRRRRIFRANKSSARLPSEGK